MLGYSEACERNKAVILQQLQTLLSGHKRVLEVGSGSGQHACFFAPQLGHLRWQPTEMEQMLPVLQANLQQYGNDNIAPAIALDMMQSQSFESRFDALYTANTLHIMPWQAVEAGFAQMPGWLQPGALLVVYGPVKYNGKFTTASNARFDLWLKQRDPRSGVRDFEALDRLAAEAGFEFVEDISMPANNQLLLWRLK